MPTEIAAPTVKQMASNLVQRMPDTATFDEIREELAILAAIHRKREAIRAGESMTHEGAVQRSAPWITQ